MSSAAKAQNGDGERKQEWHEAQSENMFRLFWYRGCKNMLADPGWFPESFNILWSLVWKAARQKMTWKWGREVIRVNNNVSLSLGKVYCLYNLPQCFSQEYTMDISALQPRPKIFDWGKTLANKRRRKEEQQQASMETVINKEQGYHTAFWGKISMKKLPLLWQR